MICRWFTLMTAWEARSFHAVRAVGAVFFLVRCSPSNRPEAQPASILSWQYHTLPASRPARRTAHTNWRCLIPRNAHSSALLPLLALLESNKLLLSINSCNHIILLFTYLSLNLLVYSLIYLLIYLYSTCLSNIWNRIIFLHICHLNIFIL